MNELLKPIPHCEDIQNEGIEEDYIDEEFIEIVESERIKLDLQYPKLAFENAIPKAYVRKSVYDMLLKAVEYLPDDYNFKILDAWRPFDLQVELFEKYSKKIIKDYQLENISKDKQDEFISRFVAMPDESLAPAHTTGGAIDLVIINKDGTDVGMGVKFDEFSDKAYSDIFEEKNAAGEQYNDIQRNRRILYNCMINAGFTNISSEIWHYDYGDRNWARRTCKKSIYRRCNSIEDLRI